MLRVLHMHKGHHDGSLVLGAVRAALGENSHLVSPLYLEWNTIENTVLRWNEVFEIANLASLVPAFAA